MSIVVMVVIVLNRSCRVRRGLVSGWGHFWRLGYSFCLPGCLQCTGGPGGDQPGRLGRVDRYSARGSGVPTIGGL